jgi:hypothetical protein
MSIENLKRLIREVGDKDDGRQRDNLYDPNVPLDDISARRLVTLFTPMQRAIVVHIATHGWYDPRSDSRPEIAKRSCGFLVNKAVIEQQVNGRYVFTKRVIDYNNRKEGIAQ